MTVRSLKSSNAIAIAPASAPASAAFCAWPAHPHHAVVDDERVDADQQHDRQDHVHQDGAVFG